MLLTVEHSGLGIKCCIHVERLLEAGGMSPEDIARCYEVVPEDLKPEVTRSTDAIKAFTEAWAAAPKDSKPTVPYWVVYIRDTSTDS